MLLSVVIPVLNEAETIPLMLSRLRDTLREETWEAIFVDDGSTDATLTSLSTPRSTTRASNCSASAETLAIRRQSPPDWILPTAMPSS